MIELESKTKLEEKIAQANPSPVLSAGADGVLDFVNPATSKLIHDLELEQVEDLLPADHKGLVRACLKTRVTLTEECQLDGRHIVWSYQLADENDVVYIYGYDVTAYQSQPSSLNRLPEANPNPVLTYNMEGTLQFKNHAVLMLLNDFELEKSDINSVFTLYL